MKLFIFAVGMDRLIGFWLRVVKHSTNECYYPMSAVWKIARLLMEFHRLALSLFLLGIKMAGTRDDGLRGTRFNALNAYLFRLSYYYTCNNLFIGILDYIFSFIKISKVNLEIGLRN